MDTSRASPPPQRRGRTIPSEQKRPLGGLVQRRTRPPLDAGRALTPTIEEYLLTIYVLQRDGVQVIGARLAEQMGVSAATVTSTIRRMVRDELVKVGAHRAIELTEQGRSLAERAMRRHGLAERLLTDILGLSWHEAHQEAHLVEHAISPRVEERLMEVLGYPATCPHGNPLPGTGALLAVDALPLAEAAPGPAVVERVDEQAEGDGLLLRFLDEHGIRPGAELEVLGVAPHLGTVEVLVSGSQRSTVLGTIAARHVWIRRR